jgi:electron transfer flavoprotein beta subunit
MVPGMISGILGYNFINSCTSLTVDETAITAIREIDGGTVFSTASINYWWTKGLVEEKDLRIPNMRGIMTARSKALTEPIDAPVNTKAVENRHLGLLYI